ncbi:MAG: glutamine synthetase beta-grasp domain-containing protein [Bacteroidota bacterium]
MAKFKFEYIWLDGYKPESNLRSKTKILSFDSYNGEVDVLPEWSFDGSSTEQAEGHTSDCLLKPVRVYVDTARKNGYLVMCEVLNPDGTPHASNRRHLLGDDEQYWFGFEQEYTFTINERPLGFPTNGYPAPQGMYYCAVGNGNIAGREIVEEHLDLCLDAGIDVTGINAEVMLGQWEYQVFGKGAKKASDDLWMSRYLLYRVAEEHQVTIEFAPKPVKGDWNGSGMHTNFSNDAMREEGGEPLFKSILDAFGELHDEHIDVYGSGNHERLTGLHETQSIEKFSYGVSDRGSSIRIPISTAKNGWKGYAEDRRPASNGDPYKITGRIIETIESVTESTVA